MSKERKILAWAALVGSIVACGPCACLSGLLSLAGGLGNLEDPSYEWGISDTALLVVTSIFTVAVAIAGIVFFVWGIRTLLSSDSGQVQPEHPLDSQRKTMSKLQLPPGSTHFQHNNVSGKRLRAVTFFLVLGIIFSCMGGYSASTLTFAPQIYEGIWSSLSIPDIEEFMEGWFPIIAWIFFACSVPLIVVAIGLILRQQWAVKVGKALCVLWMIIGLPIGTLIFALGHKLISDLRFVRDEHRTSSNNTR